MLKALLQYCCPGQEQALLRYLTPDQAKTVKELPSPAQPIVVPALHIRKIFGKIHYSWLVPLLEGQARSVYPFYFTLFSRQQAAGLSKLLQVPLEIATLPRYLRPAFMSVLTKQLTGRELLPIEYLPSSPLNALLRASKQQLVKTIHLLSFYDLAAEMKKIVDKEIIEKVDSLLNEKDRHFLELSLRHPSEEMGQSSEKLLGLLDDPSAFARRLHQRGLIRFAKALSHEDPSLIWYVTHRLDKGRGSDIEKLASNVAKGISLRPYKAQLLDVISLISAKNGQDETV